jgi:hypothetical protein
MKFACNYLQVFKCGEVLLAGEFLEVLKEVFWSEVNATGKKLR